MHGLGCRWNRVAVPLSRLVCRSAQIPKGTWNGGVLANEKGGAAQISAIACIGQHEGCGLREKREAPLSVGYSFAAGDIVIERFGSRERQKPMSWLRCRGERFQCGVFCETQRHGDESNMAQDEMEGKFFKNYLFM
ncbi:hypothetical protein [Adlercreutzia caecimuris]|uniref:hypothetical protein n=1 Tax=Adlercreutzia caecimuris TaxID=671266 RepID=UPI001C3EAE80|nr:hypothetical protein [Adlercreutzia caecimuris]